MPDRARGWIGSSLMAAFAAVVIIAALVLLGPQQPELCFCGRLYSPTAFPPNTVTPIVVPTPDKLPSMKQHCKGYAVPMC